MLSAADCPPPTDDDIRDPDRLCQWLEARFAFAGLPPSRWLMSRGIACALRAVENGHRPPKLFAALIERGLRDGWDFLAVTQIQTATESFDGMNLNSADQFSQPLRHLAAAVK